jgi:hypothetical protein
MHTQCFHHAVTGKVVVVYQAMKTCGKWRCSSIIIDLTLVRGEWSASRLGCLTHVQRALGTHWVGGYVGSRVRLGSCEEKPLVPVGNRTPAIQPVAIPTELSRLRSHMSENITTVIPKLCTRNQQNHRTSSLPTLGYSCD